MSAEKRRYIGIDLGGSKIRFGYIDSLGNIGCDYQTMLKDFVDNTELTEIVICNLQHLMAKIREEKNEVDGIGFGSPGPLDYKRGIIETPPNLSNIRHLPIVKILNESFSEYSTFLVHDADAALIGEQWLGAAAGFKNVSMVTLGTGVGFAVMDNDRLIRGKGRASEMGHTDININAHRTCSCGRANHWEAYVGTDGLVRTYCDVFDQEFSTMSSRDKYDISFEFRNWLSHQYNSIWKQILNFYCDHMILGLKNILCSFDPECIVLGGGIINGNEPLFQAIKKKWDESRSDSLKDKMASMAIGTELRLAKLPNAGVIGAAKYAMDMVHRERELRAAEYGIIT